MLWLLCMACKKMRLISTKIQNKEHPWSLLNHHGIRYSNIIFVIPILFSTTIAFFIPILFSTTTAFFIPILFSICDFRFHKQACDLDPAPPAPWRDLSLMVLRRRRKSADGGWCVCNFFEKPHRSRRFTPYDLYGKNVFFFLKCLQSL